MALFIHQLKESEVGNMVQALVPIMVDIFTDAGLIGFFMAFVAKGINILIKAATRGEIVV